MVSEEAIGNYKDRLIHERRYPLPLTSDGAAFWAARNLWTVDQAACLTFGFEPRSLSTTFRASLGIITETMKEEGADPKESAALHSSVLESFGTIRDAILANMLETTMVDELDAQTLHRVLLIDVDDEAEDGFFSCNRDFLLLKSCQYADWLCSVEGRSMPRIADPLRSALRFAKKPIMERLVRHHELVQKLHEKWQAERRLPAKVEPRIFNNALKWTAYLAKKGFGIDGASSEKLIGNAISEDGKSNLLSAPGEPGALRKYLVVGNQCIRNDMPSWGLLGRGEGPTAKSAERRR